MPWSDDYISANNALAAKWYMNDFGRMRRAHCDEAAGGRSVRSTGWTRPQSRDAARPLPQVPRAAWSRDGDGGELEAVTDPAAQARVARRTGQDRGKREPAGALRYTSTSLLRPTPPPSPVIPPL